MKLPADENSFPEIPLKGHICCLKRGEEKHYWLVENLILESKKLEVKSLRVSELLEKIGNSTWFSPEVKPSVKQIIAHIDRALKTDLTFPLILSSDDKIMDGSHRLLAAHIKGIESLPTVQFEFEPKPDYIK